MCKKIVTLHAHNCRLGQITTVEFAYSGVILRPTSNDKTMNSDGGIIVEILS